MFQKVKSMVTILRPFGEIVSSPFEIKHTSSDIHSLIKLIHSIEGESQDGTYTICSPAFSSRSLCQCC